METNNLTSINVYVTNRTIYENGTDNGLWIDITDFSDKSEFLEDVTVKLGVLDEKGLIYIDWDEQANKFINESVIYDSIFELLNYINENKHLKEPIFKYIDNLWSGNIDNFSDFIESFECRYRGEYDSEKDFAEEIFDQFDHKEIPDIYTMYFDIDAFSRDIFINDYVFIDGYVFDRY